MSSVNGELSHSPPAYWLGESEPGSPAPPSGNGKSLKRSIDHVESPELQQSDKSDVPDTFVDQFDFDTFYQYATNSLVFTSPRRPHNGTRLLIFSD
jgi:hypothetical protein